MKKPEQKDICFNCGADMGLHHYESHQCPKNGREETREGKRQEWDETTYRAKYRVEMEQSAYDLADALNDLIAIMEVSILPSGIHHTTRYETEYNKAIAALKKAGYTE